MSFFDRFRSRSAPEVRKGKSGRIDELSVLVQERPDDWTIQNELADALAQDGQIDEAVTRLCAIGDHLAAEGFLAKAHAVYKKALRLRPRHEYAASRSAELNTERITKSGSRFAIGTDEARATDAVANDVPEARESVEAAEPTLPIPADASAEVDGIADPPPADDAGELLDADPPIEPSPAPTNSEGHNAIEEMVNELRECARANPDLIEPVAKLVEVATLNGLDEVRDEAEARLCDLHYRRGDYRAARTIAEALVMRYPEEPRHRARFEFLEAELAEHEPSGERVEVPEPGVSSEHTSDTGIEAELTHDLDTLAAGDAAPAESVDSIDTRAALERAADVAEHRFAAARQLARLDADAGNWASALSWLERAATAIPTPADEEELAYDFALLLERAGEHDRALGVLHEIAAKAGAEYRDVSQRIQRLTSALEPIQEQLIAS